MNKIQLGVSHIIYYTVFDDECDTICHAVTITHHFCTLSTYKFTESNFKTHTYNNTAHTLSSQWPLILQ